MPELAAPLEVEMPVVRRVPKNVGIRHAYPAVGLGTTCRGAKLAVARAILHIARSFLPG